MERRWRRFRMAYLGLVVLALGVTLLPVAMASAHSLEPITTEPASGTVLVSSTGHVRLTFSEELNASLSGLQVFDAGGRQVDQQDGNVDLYDPDHASLIATLPPLPNGTYTVRWYAVLMDGDRVEGIYHFSVGETGTGNHPSDMNLPRAESGLPFHQNWIWLGLAAMVSAGGLGLYLWSVQYR